MRQSYSTQLRLDSQRIDEVPLNLNCRDSMIPVLKALQHVYSKPAVIDEIMSLIRCDVNRRTSSSNGREGMDYRHILVLASVRLGCNLTYDQLHDLAENHRTLRAVMGIGSWDEMTEFKWRTIRNNICLLCPETIQQINQLIVAAGHEIVPEAIEKIRADSFVMETFPLGQVDICRCRSTRCGLNKARFRNTKNPLLDRKFTHSRWSEEDHFDVCGMGAGIQPSRLAPA